MLMMITEGDKEKELGNAAYKKRDFETAMTHYNKALELDENNYSVYLNIAGTACVQMKDDRTI